MAPALRSSSKRRPGQRTGKPVGRGQPAAVKRQVHKPVVRKPVKKNKKKNADAEEESNEEDGEEGSGEEDDEKGSGEDGSPKESDKEWKPKRKMKKNKGKGKAVDVKSNNGSDKNQGSETEDINKRTFVTLFSAPSLTVGQCLLVCGGTPSMRLRGKKLPVSCKMP